jgi:predicted RNase H-like nuclease
MSKQSYAIGAGIFEVDAALQDRVYEVHPEVCFAAMKGEPLPYSKRSWNGLMERRRLLAGVGIEIPDDLAGPGAIPPADVLDAAAVAWSAQRIATGLAKALPESPPAHSGRPVAIWY